MNRELGLTGKALLVAGLSIVSGCQHRQNRTDKITNEYEITSARQQIENDDQILKNDQLRLDIAIDQGKPTQALRIQMRVDQAKMDEDKRKLEALTR